MPKTASQELLEIRQRIWALNAELVATNKSILAGLRTSINSFIPDELPEGMGLTLSVTPTPDWMELDFEVVDAASHEASFGVFTLAFTPACETNEIELIGMAFDERDERIVQDCVKAVAEKLGVRRVIFTAISVSDEGNFKLPNREIDRWMDYVETRATTDIYAWEVTL